jgi:hypothetical protein
MLLIIGDRDHDEVRSRGLVGGPCHGLDDLVIEIESAFGYDRGCSARCLGWSEKRNEKRTMTTTRKIWRKT